MTRTALALIAVLLLPLPAGAQDAGETPPEEPPGEQELSERELVLAAFTQLVDRGEARQLFGLPLDTFWRREGSLALALFADDAAALVPALEGAVAPFSEVSGLEIDVVESGPAVAPQEDAAGLAPEAEVVLAIGSRHDLAEIAASAEISRGMVDVFELGTWPFMFTFTEDDRRRGLVLLADDEPERARVAAFILATVWALGGVTLGPELTGLIEDRESGPALTERGEAVFELFFHEELEVGMPLDEAVRRAETLLPQ